MLLVVGTDLVVLQGDLVHHVTRGDVTDRGVQGLGGPEGLLVLLVVGLEGRLVGLGRGKVPGPDTGVGHHHLLVLPGVRLGHLLVRDLDRVPDQVHQALDRQDLPLPLLELPRGGASARQGVAVDRAVEGPVHLEVGKRGDGRGHLPVGHRDPQGVGLLPQEPLVYEAVQDPLRQVQLAADLDREIPQALLGQGQLALECLGRDGLVPHPGDPGPVLSAASGAPHAPGVEDGAHEGRDDQPEDGLHGTAHEIEHLSPLPSPAPPRV